MTCEAQQKWVCETLGPALPGADSSQILRVFERKVHYFLQESAIWRDEAVFRSDSQGNVQLNFQFEKIQAQIVWIERVWHRWGTVPHRTTVPPEYKDTTTTFPLLYTNTPYPDVIVLWPRPGDSIVDVTARCVLTLDECWGTNEADGGEQCIPDWLWSRYREAIREGVLGEMMREVGKPYTSLNEGAKHETKFEWWVDKARDEAKRGFGEHESEWSYPRGFAV